MTNEPALQTISPEDLENVHAGFGQYLAGAARAARFAGPAARAVGTVGRYGWAATRATGKGIMHVTNGINYVTAPLMAPVMLGMAYGMLKPIYEWGAEKITGKKTAAEVPEVVE